MPRQLTPQSSLDTLKREAKRWLKALRENDPGARTRYESAYPDGPDEPTLRDIQHALAREHSFSGWIALKDAIESRAPATPLEAALESLLDAAGEGDDARIALLVDEFPDIVSERGLRRGHTGQRTALHHAVGGRRLSTVSLLLARGANPNVRDEGDNAFPIHFAAENGDLEIVKALVEHGAETIGEGDDHQLEVIGWATCFGGFHREVADYLLAHGARQTIFAATAMGDLDAIRSIATEHPQDRDRPMDRTNHHRRPLHLAIIKKRSDSLNALLVLGADAEQADAAGLTPLDQAALNGEMGMVVSLIEHGAKIGVPSAIVLERDVDRVLRDNPGTLRPGARWGTLIIRAAEQAPARVIEALIQHGASVDATDTEETSVDGTTGYTPLHAAAFRGNIDAARALLAHGASVTARDTKYCGTPAGWASHARHPELRDLILRGSIDFFDAISFGLVDRFQEIFDRSPAMLNEPMGRSLFREPGPDEWTKSWWTPLAFAVVNGKSDAVRALLELGADTRVRDPEGRTLREIATAMGKSEMVALIEAYAPAEPPRGNDRAALAARFLSNACPDHHVRGRPAHGLSLHTAERILRDHPEIARDSIYTAVVCGELDLVRAAIAARPEIAREKGGPKGSYGAAGMTYVVDATGAAFPKWEPLLYLCFTRLNRAASNDNAVDLATMLLDNGADPNSYFMAGSSRYSPLTGVIGEGEEDRPPHPRRDELTKLLLARGANPYDMQVFYNVHFHGKVLWLLKLIYEQTIKDGRRADWEDPSWSMIGMGGYGNGARYLLTMAIRHDDVELAEWCLSHGADPNAPAPRSRQNKPARVERTASLHELALRAGSAIADLLVRHGATPSEYAPTQEDQFVAAVLRVDRTAAKRLAAELPELVRSHKAMFEAASANNVEAMKLLVDLGASIEVEDQSKQRPLHAAAWSNSLDTARFLIDRGATIDPVETNWGNSPIDFARWAGHQAMIDLLAPHSRDLWSLAITGKVERLREVLSAEPDLAKWELPNGVTPLMRLPDDEVKAIEIATLFIDRGANPNRRSDEGLTALEMAERRELTQVARLLREVTSR